MENNEVAKYQFSDIEKMADACAKSRLFGVQTKDQALALMLLAQAEGRHPMICAKEYHIIQGKPALKSEAMLSRFQRAGGKIEWIERNDKKCSAKFTHESGGELVVEWTTERAKTAELTGKDNWRKFPAQMLSARVISEGIRAVFPAVLDGMYSPEEVICFDDKKTEKPITGEHETVKPSQTSTEPEKAPQNANGAVSEPFNKLFNLDIGADKPISVGKHRGKLFKDLSNQYLVWLLDKVTTPQDLLFIIKPRLAKQWAEEVVRLKMTAEDISFVCGKYSEGRDRFSEMTIHEQCEAVEFLKKEVRHEQG